MTKAYTNPFRPGAGHMPPYLAGRSDETNEFLRLLEQGTILENLVLTGLRGVGKTVLLDSLRPLAIRNGWRWAGTDLSESSCITEEKIATRLLTDLSVVTSSIVISRTRLKEIGFTGKHREAEQRLNFNMLVSIFTETPGLVSDKLKVVLEFVWSCMSARPHKGLIFAYDEAQNLADHSGKDQFPLSLLLDTFQSIQKKGIPFMLVLTGLPTLFPKLVEARTFSERMFRVLFLDKLDEKDSRAAITKPLQGYPADLKFNEESVEAVINMSGGYPYFIQFICREVYDVFIQRYNEGEPVSVPVNEIIRKLDTDFFAGRYARATDRQRDLLSIIARLPNCDNEFTGQEITELSKKVSEKPFSRSHVNQMLTTLSDAGLVYRNRHGKYALAVPLLGQFILRQLESE
jgi:hypothetical protein